MVISLLETVIITNVLHHSSMKYQKVPKWVRVAVLTHIANLICYQRPEDLQPPSMPEQEKSDGSNSGPGPWIVQPAGQSEVQQPSCSGGNSTDSL